MEQAGFGWKCSGFGRKASSPFLRTLCFFWEIIHWYPGVWACPCSSSASWRCLARQAVTKPGCLPCKSSALFLGLSDLVLDPSSPLRRLDTVELLDLCPLSRCLNEENLFPFWWQSPHHTGDGLCHQMARACETIHFQAGKLTCFAHFWAGKGVAVFRWSPTPAGRAVFPCWVARGGWCRGSLWFGSCAAQSEGRAGAPYSHHVLPRCLLSWMLPAVDITDIKSGHRLTWPNTPPLSFLKEEWYPNWFCELSVVRAGLTTGDWGKLLSQCPAPCGVDVCSSGACGVGRSSLYLCPFCLELCLSSEEREYGAVLSLPHATRIRFMEDRCAFGFCFRQMSCYLVLLNLTAAAVWHFHFWCRTGDHWSVFKVLNCFFCWTDTFSVR